MENSDKEVVAQGNVPASDPKKSLIEVEGAIKQNQQEIGAKILAIGNCLLEIEDGKLYEQVIDKEYKNINAYLEDADARLELNKQKASDYKIIAGNYRTHKKKLDAIGYDIKDNVYKLRYLLKAIEKNEGKTDEVFKRVKIDSLKDFRAFSRGPDVGEEKKPKIRIPVDSLTDKKRITAYIRSIMSIEKKGELPLIIGIANQEEKVYLEEMLTDYRDFAQAS